MRGLLLPLVAFAALVLIASSEMAQADGAQADNADTAEKLVAQWNDGSQRIQKLRTQLSGDQAERRALLEKAARTKNVTKRSQLRTKASDILAKIKSLHG